MAEAWQQRVPVVGRWEPRQRRKASMASTVAAIALLGFAVIASLAIPSGAQTSTFLLAILVLLLVTFVFQALVVVTGMRQGASTQPDGNAAWQQAYTPPAGTPAPRPAMLPEQQLTLKCSSCATVFDVTDTGERPLRHTCPGCGVQGELSEADLGPSPAEGPTITLKCSSCGTVFDVTDTGQRPLQHVCPGCGSEGVLREEDLPAPMAAPPAIAAAPVQQQASRSMGGASVRVKTLKLRCKNCSTVFTLRDNGERPLYHECPGCKATGVLR